MSKRGIFLGILAVLLSFSAGAAAPDPEKPGPFPVGVTTMLFVDHSRTDAATNGPRSLMTEIWYPATDDAASLPKGLMASYFRLMDPAVAVALKAIADVDLQAVDKTFKCLAVRDARMRDGLFPLVLFSHGHGGIRTQDISWCEHVASHGYLVVSPDHTGNCAMTVIDGALILQKDHGIDQAAKDRPADIRFLIDQMDRMNKGADSRFQGRVDMAHIAAAGHSFGGYTATTVADEDARVKAIIAMAAVGKERKNYTCPALVLIATEDRTMKQEGNDRMRKYYEESKGPHYLVEFLNAGHFSFTDMFQFKPDFGDGVGKGKRMTNDQPITYAPMDVVFPLMNGYTTAFLGRYLKGLAPYDDYLKVNHNLKELIVKCQVK